MKSNIQAGNLDSLGMDESGCFVLLPLKSELVHILVLIHSTSADCLVMRFGRTSEEKILASSYELWKKGF